MKHFMVSLSTDKTELSLGSKRSAFPIYLSSQNLNTDVLNSDAGSVLIGFIPKLSLSDKSLKEAMDRNGIKLKKDKKKALTVLNRWLENQCLKHILAQIREMNEKGPLNFRVGSEEFAPIYEIMVAFYNFIGKVFNYRKNSFVT